MGGGDVYQWLLFVVLKVFVCSVPLNKRCWCHKQERAIWGFWRQLASRSGSRWTLVQFPEFLDVNFSLLSYE